jgi:chromosome condensin MukBEF MukE localization factor
MEMIKEASLRKFVQHRAAGSDEDYNKLSNYLSRESTSSVIRVIRKRRTQRILNSKHTHREHFTSH